MKKISTPRDLLVEELKDLYSAENQLLKALPKMAEAATSDELRTAFEEHLTQTEGHVARLEKIGSQLGEAMKGKKCKAMAGLIEEGREIMDEDAEPAMMDLALIGAAQKVEHYEIAGYGTTRHLAELAGETGIAEVLQETLDEEGEADKLLTSIADEMEIEGGDDDDADDDAGEKPSGKSRAGKSPMSEDEPAARSSADESATEKEATTATKMSDADNDADDAKSPSDSADDSKKQRPRR